MASHTGKAHDRSSEKVLINQAKMKELINSRPYNCKNLDMGFNYDSDA